MDANNRSSADIGLRSMEHSRIESVEGMPTVYSTRTSYEHSIEPPSGTQSPRPLLDVNHPNFLGTGAVGLSGLRHGLARTTSHEPKSHMGEPLESLYRAQTGRSRREASSDAVEAALPAARSVQGIPPELRNLAMEVAFVLVCSSGQLLFAFFLGDINVTQDSFGAALGLHNTQLPWLQGSYSLALGLSVVLSGSVSDLLPPRLVVVSAFAWLTIWNIIGCFALTPSRSVLFFFMRSMQGLSVGVLVSGSMSILGRVYSPGIRKTKVFSAMAAMAPFGFWIGAVQGGAFSAHLAWISGTNAILSGILLVAAWYSIPSMRPEADMPGADVPSIRDYDWKGALCVAVGCICLLFGLTSGSAAHWSPYTYSLIIVGGAFLALFFFVESKVPRPLIPTRLWSTPGFAPLMAAYFLGFGGFVGAWQFFIMQFFLRIQRKSSITVALYLLPNALVGVLATFLVSKLLHRVPGHYIYLASMLAYALGPAFFLPQKADTTYWALSMPGIALATFGPDLSFAAASIFITSNVGRSHQGSAGSLLVTIQNLSTAIMTSAADSIAVKVDSNAEGVIGLEGLRAAWWFALAAALAGALITAVAVRIPKEEEKQHVT